MSEEEVNVVTSEGMVHTSISTTTATPDEITAIAKEIWKKFRAEKVKGDENVLSRYQQEWPEFSTTFPVVLRHMILSGEFKVSIFKEYLKAYARKKIESHDDFLAAQGEYFVCIWKFNNASLHPSQDMVQEVRDKILADLQEEKKQFAAAQEIADKELKEMNEKISAERRAEIRQMVMERMINATVPPPAAALRE